MKKLICALLAAALLASSAVSVPALEAPDKAAAPELDEGDYAPNQAVVLFKDGAVEADAKPQKGGLEAVGASFGDMMDASGSENEAVAAACDELGIVHLEAQVDGGADTAVGDIVCTVGRANKPRGILVRSGDGACRL